ncbi:MAG: hypothetical protein ABJH72_04355 [Reichenbachiella sp.]|uniref:hypothetical protein n=1 Tax=Reichenbachiella sp. TaxID=2184521 RepID=UPI00329A7189
MRPHHFKDFQGDLKKTHKYCVALAKDNHFTTYSAILTVFDWKEAFVIQIRKLSFLLDEISILEHKKGNGLLSSVIIREDKGRPGVGFFKMAKRLTLYSGIIIDGNITEMSGFHQEQLDLVHSKFQ